MATVTKLSAEETRECGFTHKAIVRHTDLTGTAATSKVETLLSGLTAGTLVQAAAFRLVTPFDGGATTNLALDVGWNLAAGTDDPDGLLDNYEIHVDATEVLAGDGNGAAFATLRTGFAFQESGSIEALLTATGANLSALTTGEVWIYLSVVDLDNY